MPDNKILELIKHVNGEPMLSVDALGLLFGVSGQDVADYINANTRDGACMFPPEWMQTAHRRKSEAAAGTGSNDTIDLLAYWARHDLNAAITLIDSTNQEGNENR